MKMAIIGSRTFEDYEFLKSHLDSITVRPFTIISGGAKGADSLAKKYAKENNLKLIEFKPDYKTFGKSAPHVRNDEIIENADIIIAFWDGQSKGTASVIKKGKDKVTVIRTNGK